MKPALPGSTKRSDEKTKSFCYLLYPKWFR
jgi:hypothetical protein